jgi:signal transduction histidine kinase
MTTGSNRPEILFTHPGSPLIITDQPFFSPQDVLLSIRESSHQPEGVNEQSGAREPTYHVLKKRPGRSSAKLRATIKLMKQLIDGLPWGAYLVRGASARLVMANRAALATWGVIWEPGQPLQQFLNAHHVPTSPEASPQHWNRYDTVEASQPGSSDEARHVLIRHPDGTPHLLRLHVIALDAALLSSLQAKRARAAHTAGSWAVILLQDMSALQEAERLKQDIQALKAAEQQKDDFIATAAHELRSPLTTLIGYTEMLRQQTAASEGAELAEWQVEALETIAHDTMQVVSLANDLLDVTRLEAGQLELYCYSANLAHLIQRVVTRLQNSSKAHTLVVEAPPAPILVNMDTRRIEQVLHNLISNAIKYSPQGGQVLIIVREHQDNGVAEIAVCDQGIGIPASQQGRIFSRFFRADNARMQAIEGTGLGLYLCRELIHRHGGRIGFESTEGQGSTFSFTLPLAPASDL